MKKIIVLLLLICSGVKAHANTVSNETEVGLAVAQGNTQSQTYNLKQTNGYLLDKNIFKFNGRYLNAFAGDIESARYLSLALRYERELSSAFFLFFSEGIEKDYFAGYRSRINSDFGGKYFFYKEDVKTFFIEAGYRYTTEKKLNNTKNYSNSLRLFADLDNKWSTNFSTHWWIEYLPNLDNSKDYLFNTEVSIAAVINSIFSLKTGYLLRYDNQPIIGIQHKTDTLLTTSIVSKF